MSKNRSWRSFVASAAVLCIGLAIGPPRNAEAEPKDESRNEAREMLAEALHQEIYGNEQSRQRLLVGSLLLAPEYAPARWQNGFVRYNNRWIEAGKIANTDDFQARLDVYERQRLKTPKNPAGQLALANWCAENGFLLQERAHLNQVIEDLPDHPEARRRLGFQRVGGRWIEASAIWKGFQQSEATARGLQRWSDQIRNIAKHLHSRNETKRAEAREQLRNIDEVSAIPALELLASRSEPDAQQVVEALALMSYHQASLALARLGVFSPWEEVRATAAKSLVQRSRDGYVPALLAEMVSPVESRIQGVRVGRRIFYRHAFYREGQEQNEMLVLDTVYRPLFVDAGATGRPGVPNAGGVPNVPGVPEVPGVGNRTGGGGRRGSGTGIGQAVTEMRRTALQREQRRLLQNAWSNQVNVRICSVLQAATGEQLPAKPDAWWKWWDQQNEIVHLGQKRTNYRYQRDQRRYLQPVASTNATPQPRRQRGECFVAGTPVCTARGPLAIELVQPGDLVLAQDPDTGELNYSPVLATSVRPEEELVKIDTDVETLEASGGHPLWVNGQGWVLARQLDSGMVLHGQQGPVLVSDVRPGSRQKTYNLVVADMHTYFVGRGRVLCHDNTPRRPTNAAVPGLFR